MDRYVLYGNEYSAANQGGWHDYWGEENDLQKLIEFAKTFQDDKEAPDANLDWMHIVDLEEGQIIWEWVNENSTNNL